MSFDFLTPQLSMKKNLKSVFGNAGVLSSQDSGVKESTSNLFLTKLNQMLAKNGINNRVSSIDLTATSAYSNSNVEISSESVKSDLLNEVNTKQGFEFLAKFKQYIMASGYNDLKDVFIGENGLDAIKIVLNKVGFSNSKVTQIVDVLKAESDDGKVSLSALMDELLSIESEGSSEADLTIDNDANDSDDFSIDKRTDKNSSDLNSDEKSISQFLDISAIPFISSIMKSLDIPDNIIDSVIADSEIKGEGVELNALISELQYLQKNSFFTGTSFKNSSDAKSIREMFEQLDLSAKIDEAESDVIQKSSVKKIETLYANGNEKEIVTLGDFVSKLEELRQKSFLKSKNSGDSEESYGNSLTQKRSSVNPLLDISTNTINSEADLLIKKIMGDIHINNSVSNSIKDAKEEQSTETEFRYRTLKSTNHQLLMNLSEVPNSEQYLDNTSIENKLSEFAKSGDKDLKELLTSLGIVVKNKTNEEIVTEIDQISSDENSTKLAEKVSTLATSSNSTAPVLTQSEESISAKQSDIKELLSSLGIVVKSRTNEEIVTEIDQISSDENSTKLAEKVSTLATSSNSTAPVLTQSEESISAKQSDIKELLSSLGIVLKSKIDGAGTSLKPDDTANDIVEDPKIAQTNKTNSKISSDLLEEINQKKITNIEEIEKEQKNKILSGVYNNISSFDEVSKSSGTSTLTGTQNSDVVAETINILSNSEVFNSKKNGLYNSRTTHNENEFNSIISGVEKKESINSLDSNQLSDGSFSNQSDTKGSSLNITTGGKSASSLPSYVTNQVIRSINRAITNGENEIRLQLRPAELGRIFMTIETQGDTLRVSVVTENQAAKDLLTANVNELKASLANSGINIESFDVDMGSDFKQSMANSGQQSQNGSDSGRNRGSSIQNSSISTGDIEGTGVNNIFKNEDGNLHFVA